LKAEPKALSLTLEGRDVRIFLYRGRGRRVRLTVLSNGQVRLHAPRGIRPEEALAFAREKGAWIGRTLRKIESYTRLPGPGRGGDQDSISYLGQSYPLKVEKGRRAARLSHGLLVVRVPDPADRDQIRRRVDAWLKEWAREAFSRIMKRSLAAASEHGIAEPGWTVRLMKRRWGSCSRKGRIVLNVRLVQTPVELIEYVIMHELCHLRHHNHGRGFYALLTRLMPDWKERRKALGRIVLD
jgi:predicted metal-dependent hydrolase